MLNPNRPRGSAEDRFWLQVNRDGPWSDRMQSKCWTFGKSDRNGYRMFRVEGRFVQVHRFAYELLVGVIADGLVLDHLCRNRPCCNPRHLEPVTDAENIARGEGIAPREAALTHCPSNHPYSGRNLLIRTQRGRPVRRCRECRNASERRRLARKKEVQS